jgi:1-acyl-sn-glycerol-3-phosphate acyltransferase
MMLLSLYFSIVFSFILGRKRDIRADSRELIEHREPKPEIRNMELIPKGGPFLVTLNHYSRPGFFILWAAVAISAALPRPAIWLITGAWTNRTGGIDQVRTWLTRIIFERLAEMYDMVTMPPMSPAPGDSAERALSIRRLLKKLWEDKDAIVCIAPEGMDFPEGKLGVPHPGTGKLLLQTAWLAQQVLPVGVYEEGGRLIIHFGEPYELTVEEGLAEIDHAAKEKIMRKIAELLPKGMRGVYG